MSIRLSQIAYKPMLICNYVRNLGALFTDGRSVKWRAMCVRLDGSAECALDSALHRRGKRYIFDGCFQTSNSSQFVKKIPSRSLGAARLRLAVGSGKGWFCDD